MRTSLVSSVFFSVFSVMSFLKFLMFFAAVQSKKLLRTKRSADQSTILGHGGISVVLSHDLPVGAVVVDNIEGLYRGRRIVSYPGNFMQLYDVPTVLKTPGGYCLNIPVNIEFLQAHPDLDWSLSIAVRNAKLDGRK